MFITKHLLFLKKYLFHFNYVDIGCVCVCVRAHAPAYCHLSRAQWYLFHGQKQHAESALSPIESTDFRFRSPGFLGKLYHLPYLSLCLRISARCSRASASSTNVSGNVCPHLPLLFPQVLPSGCLIAQGEQNDCPANLRALCGFH